MQFWSWHSPYKTLNLELYTLKGWILQYVNYISIKKKNLTWFTKSRRTWSGLNVSHCPPSSGLPSPLGFTILHLLLRLSSPHTLTAKLCAPHAVYSSSLPSLTSSLGYLLLVLPVSAWDDVLQKAFPDLPRLGLDIPKAFLWESDI